MIIPPSQTSTMQPNDVGINGPFKVLLRKVWNDWFEKGEKEFTDRGNRKRPSWERFWVWSLPQSKASR
ncbi:MAG: hypothetical protein AAF438_23465, partial [Pseudomonadota bacterium]